MTTKTITIPVPSRRVVVLLLLLLLAAIVAGPAMRVYRTFNDARDCALGGCEAELPGRWSDGERTITLDDDGTFIARADGRIMRGTWDVFGRQICFVSGGENECMDYQYMGELLMLDEALYERQ